MPSTSVLAEESAMSEMNPSVVPSPHPCIRSSMSNSPLNTRQTKFVDSRLRDNRHQLITDPDVPRTIPWAVRPPVRHAAALAANRYQNRTISLWSRTSPSLEKVGPNPHPAGSFRECGTPRRGVGAARTGGTARAGADGERPGVSTRDARPAANGPRPPSAPRPRTRAVDGGAIRAPASPDQVSPGQPGLGQRHGPRRPGTEGHDRRGHDADQPARTRGSGGSETVLADGSTRLRSLHGRPSASATATAAAVSRLVRHQPYGGRHAPTRKCQGRRTPGVRDGGSAERQP